MSSPSALSRRWLALLCAAACSVALLATGCGGSDSEDSASSDTSGQTQSVDPSATSDDAGAGDDSATDDEAADSGAAAADTAEGKKLFTSSNCSSCHTLADAGAEGRIGPNLDEVKPSAALVTQYMNEGPGSMPSFKGQLSEAQIQAVSEYVASVAGQ